jgi:hypothetical protein
MRTTSDLSLVTFTEQQYDAVLRFIPCGRESARTTHNVRVFSGIEDDSTNRRTRAIFVAANERGVPVVANGKGVFIAETVEELEAFIENLEKRQLALATRVTTLRAIRLDPGC